MADPTEPPDATAEALNRIADQLEALRSELSRANATAIKRRRAVAQRVLAEIELVPSELEMARARKALRRYTTG